jgi:anti-sigma factor RsiW
MNCPEARERFSAWIDGELPTAQAAAVQAHVDRCAECAVRCRRLRAVEEALDRVAEIDPSADFADRVLAAARARRASDKLVRLPFGLQVLTRAAALLMAVAGTYLGVEMGGAPSAPAAPPGTAVAEPLMQATAPDALTEAYLEMVDRAAETGGAG